MKKKFQNILLIIIALFILHAIEEWYTEMFNVDWFFMRSASFFHTTSETVFLIFELIWCTFLIILFWGILKGKWRFPIMILLGIILLFETQHLISAILAWGYYPGSITSLMLLAVTPIFWKEVIHFYRDQHKLKS